jgi:4-carboxymuconolactone decarboxylase
MRAAIPGRKETPMADEQDVLARGREVAGRLWGAGAGGQELPAQRLAPEFFALVTQVVFGMFWSRPNLDLRSRSLCTVAQLAALGRTDELRAHLLGARNLGIRREELIEVLMQTACYAGVPAAVGALNAAADVLKD